MEMRAGLPGGGGGGNAGSCDSLSRQGSLSATTDSLSPFYPSQHHQHHHLLLPVDPSLGGGVGSRARSRSFDCAAQDSTAGPATEPVSPSPLHHQAGPLFGMLRRSFSRHSSTSETAPGASGQTPGSGTGSAVCIHCLCVEEYERMMEGQRQGSPLMDPDSEYDSYPSSGSDGEDQQMRLSFLGESFECRQKVEPWIRESNEMCAPDGPAGRAHIRRGGSLGLAPPSAGLTEPIHPQLRRGGSECQPQPHRQPPEHQGSLSGFQQVRPAISFNFSFSSSSGSQYQVSSMSAADCGGARCPTPVSGRRSPSTPRLERQEALCSGWLETEPSLELPPSVQPGLRPSHASMETHASASLEVDSGLAGGARSSIHHQETSLESQSSLPTLSLDVQLAPTRSNSVRLSSLESENSVESTASFQLPSHRTGAGGSLLARRKCLSAGASPSSSPPCSLSGKSKSSGYPGRLNLCATGSCSSADYADASALSPSPPAEIYLAVPVLTPTLSPIPVAAAAATASAMSSSSSSGNANKPSFLLRQRFRGRNDSSRSSSDKDVKDSGSLPTPLPPPPPPPPTPPLPRPLAACSSLHARGLSRSGDSLHPRMDPPLRSRSIEIGLPTAHHHRQHYHQQPHHHRTEYHDLAGSARRQQWVSRLK